MTNFPNQAIFDGEDVLSAVDWLGNRFGVGDVVAYAIGAGRGQMIALGKVQKLRVDEHSKTAWFYGPPALRSVVRLVSPENWNIEVQVLTEKTSGNWGNGKRSRPAWVNPMNITAVNGFERGAIRALEDSDES